MSLGWKPAPDLIWIEYTESQGWVVYNPRSADIHVLTDAARNLLELVSDGQFHSTEELAGRLRKDTDGSVDSELLALTQQTLDFLDRAGLISPV